MSSTEARRRFLLITKPLTRQNEEKYGRIISQYTKRGIGGNGI
mgnify:CR=1 FL=1